jgi:hypothetical protein
MYPAKGKNDPENPSLLCPGEAIAVFKNIRQGRVSLHIARRQNFPLGKRLVEDFTSVVPSLLLWTTKKRAPVRKKVFY